MIHRNVWLAIVLIQESFSVTLFCPFLSSSLCLPLFSVLEQNVKRAVKKKKHTLAAISVKRRSHNLHLMSAFVYSPQGTLETEAPAEQETK